MARFDNYIHENIEFDIQQYISSHTLFMLGAFGLSRLESLFRRIYNATRRVNRAAAEGADAENSQENQSMS